jgi:hypothetical protein
MWILFVFSCLQWDGKFCQVENLSPVAYFKTQEECASKLNKDSFCALKIEKD